MSTVKRRIFATFALLVVLALLPLPASAQPNYPTPNDPAFQPGHEWDQWWAEENRGIGAYRAWELTKETRKAPRSIQIALIDGGVRHTHEEMVNTIRSIGSEDGYSSSHATQMAGIMVGEINNQKGAAGICQACVVVSYRVTYDNDTINLNIMAAKIRQAADEGARIINISMGDDQMETQNMKSALDYAIEKGAIIVAAAGNSGVEGVAFPARHPGVIGVSATDATGNLASFSNWGAEVDFSAPGWEIYTPNASTDSGYARSSGTSNSAAFVSGALGLILSWGPEGMTNWDALVILHDTATDPNGGGWDPQYGYGIIHVGRAMALLLKPNKVYLPVAKNRR